MSRSRKDWLVSASFLGLVVAGRRYLQRGRPAAGQGKRLRLAYVAQSVHRAGGPAGYVAELIERLSPEHLVTVFSSEIDERLRPRVQHCRVPYLANSWLLSYLSFALGNSLVIAVRRLLGEKFDIIHSNGLDSPFWGDVFTCHFCEGAGLELEEQGLGRLPTTSWRQRLRSWDYHGYRHLVAWIERLVVERRGQRRIIAVSTRTREDLLRLYGEAGSRIEVIPNGVNLDRFHLRNRSRFRDQVRQELGVGPQDILLLFVGHDWERKGLPQLLAALALLEEEKARLVVVGRGDVAHYTAVAQSLGVASQVSFPGPSRQVEGYYAAADIFAFPTLYESFGLAIVEAMASGLAVLTSRLAGAADYIIPGESGLLLDDPTDPREIAIKLSRLVDQPELRQRLGHRAAEVVKDLSWDEVALRVGELYHQLVAERKAVGKPQPAWDAGA